MGETVRIGRFKVCGINLGGRGSECNPALLAVFGRCVILEARYNLVGDTMEYVAYSPDFEPADRDSVMTLDDTTIPRYGWLITRRPDGTHDVAARRAGGAND